MFTGKVINSCESCRKILNISHRLPRDNQRDKEQQTLLKSISSHKEKIPVWEQLATDQFDPWQVVPEQVFIPYSCLLISTAFVFFSRVGYLGVTGVYLDTQKKLSP